VLVSCLGDIGLDPRPGAHAAASASLLARTQATDVAAWVDALGGRSRLYQPHVRSWLEGANWLFVSGYTLLLLPDPGALLEIAGTARTSGTQVAVGLAAAPMIAAYGPARFRQAWQSLHPAVIFAGDEEWRATNEGTTGAVASSFGAGGTSVLVLENGPDGCTFVIDGVGDHRKLSGPVVDAAGVREALAAGFMLGGVDLAMRAAAHCVSTSGRLPERDLR
jgi:sugar/nucleoside kinase (ribokinase family)